MHQLIADKIKELGVRALMPQRLLEDVGHEEDQQHLLRTLEKDLWCPGEVELINNAEVGFRALEIANFIESHLVERLAFLERTFENKRLKAALERVKMQDHATLRIGLLIEENTEFFCFQCLLGS